MAEMCKNCGKPIGRGESSREGIGGTKKLGPVHYPDCPKDDEKSN